MENHIQYNSLSRKQTKGIRRISSWQSGNRRIWIDTEKGVGSPKWKHRMNLPQRSWSFSGTSRLCRLLWHNGVSQSQRSPTGGKPCYFAEARSLLQLLVGDSCHLAERTRFPTDLRLCHPSPPPLAPSHASPGAPPGAAVGPRGVAGAPGASGARGTRARGGRLPGAQLVARSL